MARTFIASMMLASSSLTWGARDYIVTTALLVCVVVLIWWVYRKPDSIL